MLFGGIFMWLFWIILIVALVALVRGFANGGGVSNTPDGNDPLDILQKRYARGEIGRDEYLEKRRELEK